MSAAAPWSVKGIDPKAREIAKDLARRSGMTLGEWLNSMIMEDGDEEEAYTPLPRRPHAAEMFDRRGRARRLDDAYGADETTQRMSASIDAIAARLEAVERRSTVAITGVDQAVTGLVRRLETQDEQGKTWGRRIDDIADELREGHKRLRRFEQETGPQTQEGFGKVKTSLGALASRLYDIEERQRGGVSELRQRMDALEKAAGPGVTTDILAQVGQRLDAAQNRTTDALRQLERSFAGLDQRLRAAESRVEPEGAREAARFEKLAETLARQVEANRIEMMHRLDTAETEGRIDRVERALAALGEQARAAEQRSAQGIEAMGREVLRMAQNLNGRVERIETTAAEQVARMGRELGERTDREIGRLAQTIEQRMVAADDRHALALERLGGEITRISDRLSERIAQSERRSTQALEDIGRRLSESAEKTDQRYDRASGELAERMRLSEERTAQLLAEAREAMAQRAAPARETAPAAVADLAQPDWRAAAFPEETFEGGDPWAQDPLSAEVAASPFPTAEAFQPQPEPVTPSFAPAYEPAYQEAPAEAASPFGAAPAFGAFGGADVQDALAQTAPGYGYDAGSDDFAAETEFVGARGATRSASTRSAIDAARAAMTSPEPEPAPRQGFSLKRGGKSRLQERLDRQANRDGSTVRKTLLASVTAVALTAGVYGYVQLTDGSALEIPGMDALTGGSDEPTEATPIAALAITPTDAVPVDQGEAATLFTQASEQLTGADPAAGLATLKRAAELGYAPAQLHLAGLYQTGENGVTIDLAEARLWARRAAEGGDARGMHAYGMYLFDGVGGARNRPEALDWLKKAANAGLIDSQYNVARIYESGDEGVAKNPTEALKWYIIAARTGDQEAQAAIGRLTSTLPAQARQTARREAETFQTAPLA